MLTPGIRVIRGYDWVWNDQDGGAGGVGTVCEIGQPGSKRSPDKTVVVNWDCGIRSNYRVGYQGQYDLVVLDNAQCGVYHSSIDCDSCKQNGIAGIRYKCTTCADFDLCSICYHSDKHDREHIFARYDTPISCGVKLTARSAEHRICVKGIFPGAIIQRGHDWKWEDQDGGDGSTGIVTDICNWAIESQRSVACVTWQKGGGNDYRVGHKGIVDLKCHTPASGGYYYISHLPILGKKTELVVGEPESVASLAPPIVPTKFNVGDRVKVMLEVDTLKNLQQGHGGWNPRMIEYIGKVGMVHRITDRGDVRVQYEGCANRWTFHSAALELVHSYSVGDMVRVLSEGNMVKQLQKQHGEWIQSMEAILGKQGRITNIYPDGDLRIQITESAKPSMWTVNPACVKLVQKAPVAVLSGAEGTQEQAGAAPDRPELRLLMSKVAQGNLDFVRDVFEKSSGLLDTAYCGKTPLQVAAYQGHLALVTFLLEHAQVRAGCVDDDGDTALHDAAFGNQPEILEVLLNHPDVDINSPNRSRCTALHIASHKCLPHCVTVLLRYHPDVNIQDTYGDTPLHDAINYQCGPVPGARAEPTLEAEGTDQDLPNVPATGSARIIQMLCEYPGMDFSLANKRGFNVLQHAALKGNGFACTVICRKAPHLVNTVKDDGFSPLHLAALNGHKDAVSALAKVGGTDTNLRNNRQQTPLLLAISQGHCIVIELLVNLGCDITALDEDGNTALHIVIMKRANAQSSEVVRPNARDCPGIFSIYENLESSNVGNYRLTCAIAIFIIKKGCDPEIKNKDNKTFYELLGAESNIAEIIREKAEMFNQSPDEDSEATTPENPSSPPGLEESVAQISIVDQRLHPPDSVFARPNSMREIAFSGSKDNAGSNINQSPHKRNYNYNNYNELGESSTNNSPIHVSKSNKPINTGSPLLPTRPARQRKPAAQNAADPNVAVSRSKPAECLVCCELSEENCTFEPCGHRIACEDCAGRMKKCLSCGSVVERRVTIDGRVIACRSRQPSAERLRYLECKIQEIEETHCCGICMERRRSVAFLCGHSACSKCADTLATCHMCRKQITNKINLY